MEQPARPLAQPPARPLDQPAVKPAVKPGRFNLALLVSVLLCLVVWWASVALVVSWLT
jgi:hypothetical protein